MFHSTVAESFQSWDRFLAAYYEPIRTALALLPFVGENQADDVAQSFFMKMVERDILDKRPAITGKFRNWLYVAARRHAIDEWRKIHRRPERSAAPADPEPVDAGAEDAPADADLSYALSILHMTVARVRKHLIEEGKSEHWMIFEELVLAPLVPGRVPKTREALLAMFPGEPPGFLDNRITTVKRVFRRILPALIPADPTDALTPEARFEELLEILQESKTDRLWLAFLTRPAPGPDQSTGSSLDFAVPSFAGELPEAKLSAEVVNDELRILLGFWLEMPFSDYLDDLEAAGPTIARLLDDSRPAALSGSIALPRPPSIFAPSSTPITPRSPRFHRTSSCPCSIGSRPTPSKCTGSPSRQKPQSARGARLVAKAPCRSRSPRSCTISPALALSRCGTRVIGLSDDRYRKNVFWLLSQPWLDPTLRRVFSAALEQLDAGRVS